MRTFILVFALMVTVVGAYLYAANRPDFEVATKPAYNPADLSRILEIKYALLREFGRDAVGVSVAVQGNAAALSGAVGERSTQKLAGEVADSVNGIVVVHNFLELETTNASGAEGPQSFADREAYDNALRNTVRSALASSLGGATDAVSVDACDGVVSLSGTLPAGIDRDVAVRVAGSTAGVTKVINLLDVASGATAATGRS